MNFIFEGQWQISLAKSVAQTWPQPFSTSVHGSSTHMVIPYFGKIPTRVFNSKLCTGLKHPLKPRRRGAWRYSQALGFADEGSSASRKVHF